MKRRGHQIPALIGDVRRLRQKHHDRLLTLLAILLVLTMFVFAPLQAVDVFIFRGFAIAALLAIIGSMLIISDNPAAFVVMSVCLIANVVVFMLRLLYPPWPYNLYILAAAWLVIAITLGIVVAQGVFRRGRITYHRIVGAILLYLLIAVVFGTLFVFVGLSISGCIQGDSIRRQSRPCKFGLLFEFRHTDINGIRRRRSGASDRAEPVQSRKRHWSAFSGDAAGETS